MKKDFKRILKDEVKSINLTMSEKVLNTPIQEQKHEQVYKIEKHCNKLNFKPLFIGMCALVVVMISIFSLLLSTTTFQVNNQASAITGYVIDINPSLCVVTDNDDNVLNTFSLNNDGDKIVYDLDSNNVNGKKFEEALKMIIKFSIEEGFILEDSPPLINLAVTNNHDRFARKSGEFAKLVFEKELESFGIQNFDIKNNPMAIADFKQRVGFDKTSNNLDDYRTDFLNRPKYFDPNFLPPPPKH